MNAVTIAKLTEIGLITVVFLLVVFQVVVPLIAGTPFFPFLRHKTRDAVDELAEAMEDKEIMDVKKSAALLREPGVQKKSTRKGA